ncbi:hypothetical protein E2986_01645 [Frieseomelitta varia]|uniref:Dehydrogenase/reductase SDR family member 4 n=1 Tax=Frieseomelitta varia TaxID=561572 RepID=A0A833S238_9HYME|nr:tropinone reductase-like 3 [Frieseomelitta varia]KAF3429060.1 hypothetical protein E2986_01645 [Frieseomelitta varia]
MLRSSIGKTMHQVTRSLSTIKCKRLEGKVAIVTASTEGIGFGIAKRLGEEGAKVMISSRKETNVKKALEQLKSKGLNVCGTICNVGKSEDRKNLLEKTKQEFGGLDILVSNAGINPAATTFFETSEEVWDKIFDINVKSTFLLIQESLPLLRKSKSPSIIIISSIAGYMSFPFLGAYCVSKTALLGLNQVAAETLAPEGIRVNCIGPGIIKTKLSKMLYEGEIADTMLSTIPMQRFGEPDDIAKVAAFLASDDASYITGETIVATGGIRSRL